MGFKNVAYIVMEGSIMCGHRITSKMIDEEVHNITEDASEAAVMSAPKSDTSQGRINNASDYYRFHTKASCTHSDGHSLIHFIFTSLIDHHSFRCCIFTSLIDHHSLRHCISISSIDCHSFRHCIFISSTDHHSLRHCVFSSFIDRYI